MKRLAFSFVTLVLAACASGPAPTPGISDLAASEAVVLQDLHPPEEDKREAFSYLAHSERVGILRNGAVKMEPPTLRLLQHRAFERLGAQGPVTIKVHHFVVYQNMQKAVRGAGIGAVAGVLGAVIVSSAPKDDLSGSFAVVDPAVFASTAGDNEWKRGVTSREENPTNAGAYIVWADVEINGKRVLVRGVSPLKAPEGKRPDFVAFESTFDFLLRQF